jgi:hypothetical protein
MNRTVIATAIIAAILTCAAATAQDSVRHEFSANIGGGASWLQSRPTLGDSHGSWTGAVGVGYHYILNRHWMLVSGVNFAIYNAGISIDNAEQQQAAAGMVLGGPMEFTVTSPEYNEKQQSMMITVPIMGQYLYRSDENIGFYTAFGFKVGIPVSTKATPEGTFTTKAYYPDINVTYEDIPDYGLVTNQPFSESKTRIDVNPSIMASLEVGAQWMLKGASTIYAGVYTDFGINKSLDRKDAAAGVNNLVVYQSDKPDQFAYNTATDAYARKVAPVTVGVTVRWVFHTM